MKHVLTANDPSLVGGSMTLPGAVNPAPAAFSFPLRPVIFAPLNSPNDSASDDQTKRLHVSGPDSGPIPDTVIFERKDNGNGKS